METKATRTDDLSELQRAGIAIKTLRARLTSIEAARSEPIAVVGMGCRFPGGGDGRESYWRLLVEGRDVVADLSDGRWDTEAYYAAGPPRPGKMYTKAGGFLSGIDTFDAGFFNLLSAEAQAMDPQQRLLLETAWEALEDAGELPERSAAAPVGVFLGITSGDYGMRVRDEADPKYMDGNYLAGNPLNTAAGRVSYTLGFTGPSVAVDTACSSSLVALHLGIRSLRAGECAMALAAGVNVLLCPKSTAMLCQSSLMSPGGRCRTYDAGADGMVRGEGAGVVVLKRLRDALADGNHIHAVIRGSAMNQDGPSSSLTAPSGRAQEAVLRAALADARLTPSEVDYVEGHGSATPLGDPIEVRSLGTVYGAGRDPARPLWIGSVKTNIGHLESAAGMAGLFKVVLSLQHGRMVRQLHFSRPNPEIDWERCRVQVCAADRDWVRSEAPRRGAVSGFGVSGTNAHVIVEEAPPPQAPGPSRSRHALVLSAPTSTGLDALTRRLAEHLASHPEQSFADVAYTLQTGRASFPFRRVTVCAGREEAMDRLSSLDVERVVTRQVARGRQRPVVFLFPGTGEYQLGMGRGLYEEEPLFRQEIDQCARLFEKELHCDLAQVLSGAAAPPENGPAADALDRASVFALEYALGRLLMAWGIRPQMLVGQGVGEIVAACLAEVLTLEAAVAAVARGTAARVLATQLRLNPPQIPLLSAATGRRMTAEEAQDVAYWLRPEARDAALTAAVAVAGENADRVLVEVGPGRSLSRIAAAALPANGHERLVLGALPAPGADAATASDVAWLQQLMGLLWANGVAVDWRASHEGQPRLKTPLPTYPFERQRYWIELAGRPAVAAETAEASKLPLERWFHAPTWIRRNQELSAEALAEVVRPLRWLVFTDPQSDTLGTVAALRRRGARLVTVEPGETFAEVAPDRYTIAPQRAEDYAALIETVRRTLGLPDVILHQWNATAARALEPTPASAEAAETAFLGLLHLARALQGIDASHPLRLCVVASNVHAVTGDEIVVPEKALLLGPCRVIAQEHPSIACVVVDVDMAKGEVHQGPQLLWEAAGGSSSADALVAYRGRSRWVRTYEALECAIPVRPALREQGVYLITGGLGGVGLALASELASRYRARLVLLGRRALPPLERIRDLEAKGAEVLVVQADVSDEASLDAALATARQRFGTIHGVIHAAGLPGAGLMAAKAPADALRVFAPKVKGTILLARALKDERLDFLLLCSSSIGVLGGVGQSDYCAANAFMDAYAEHERAQGRPVVSVAWDMWEIDGWQDELLKTMPSLLGYFKELRARYGIRPEEGAAVLERVCASGQPHVIVATRRFATQQRESAAATIDRIVNAAPRSQAIQPRPPLKVEYVAPRSPVEESLAGLWARLFDLDKVGVEDDYFDLGGDSLNGLQLLSHVRETFGIEISLHDLFEQPTIAAMSLLVEERIVANLEAVSSN